MTDREYVHYVLIVDRSGSMHAVREDMEGGLRSFVGEQLEGVDGSKRTVSLYQFDTAHDCVYDFDLLEKARGYQLVPRGGTALLDACGRAITEVGRKLAAMPEDKRPGYVMVIIVTDGQENSSREFSKTGVRKMIEHQQSEYDWRFTYLGANQDAFAEAASIGIVASSTLSWLGTPESTMAACDVLSASVSAGTVSTSTGIYYSHAQRERVVS